MKWKLLLCACLLFATCSCASWYAERTEVEIYNPETGKLIGKVFSNKGYDGFTCRGNYEAHGVGSFVWQAHKVTSNSVAKQVGENNKELTRSLTGLVRKVAGIPAPNPFTGR